MISACSAADLVPGDGKILESTALLVDEAVLTGEPFPVEKAPATAPKNATLTQRPGALFKGTSIRSGSSHHEMPPGKRERSAESSELR